MINLLYLMNLMLWFVFPAVFHCVQMWADVLLLFSSGSVLSALRRRSAGEFLVEDPNPCFSLRENEDQRQLLCNDRRSKFNFNPFGLRFGKRHSGYTFRRAVQRARTNTLSPLSLFLRELEVPTWDRSVFLCGLLSHCWKENQHVTSLSMCSKRSFTSDEMFLWIKLLY